MRRAAAQARADALVRAHRFELSVVVPLVGAGLLVAGGLGWLPPALAFDPLLVVAGVVVMRLPLLVALGPLADRRTLAALVALVGFAYAVEAVALATGWPYGTFTYGVTLGPTVAGVPVALPLLYLPIVVDGTLLATLLLGPGAGRWHRRSLALGLLVTVDLVLDPGAVVLGFWSYAAGGAYYDVPASNYAGWLLTGAVAVWAVDAALARTPLAARLDGCTFALDDLVSFGLLWGVVNLAVGQAVPAVLAAGLLALLGLSGRYDLPRPRPSGPAWLRRRLGAALEAGRAPLER